MASVRDRSAHLDKKVFEQKRITTWLPHLPRLRTIEIDFVFASDYLQDWLTAGLKTLPVITSNIESFAQACRDVTDNVSVRTDLYIFTDLYAMGEDLSVAEIKTADKLCIYDDNWMLCRATWSDVPNKVEDLELEITKCGSFNREKYDKCLARFRRAENGEILWEDAEDSEWEEVDDAYC